MTVVVSTSVDVETGSLHPNHPGSLHVLVVCVGSFPEVVDTVGGGETGLVCGGEVAVGLGAESSLHPHQPGVAQCDVVVVVVISVFVVVVLVVVTLVLKSDLVLTDTIVVVSSRHPHHPGVLQVLVLVVRVLVVEILLVVVVE